MSTRPTQSVPAEGSREFTGAALPTTPKLEIGSHPFASAISTALHHGVALLFGHPVPDGQGALTVPTATNLSEPNPPFAVAARMLPLGGLSTEAMHVMAIVIGLVPAALHQLLAPGIAITGGFPGSAGPEALDGVEDLTKRSITYSHPLSFPAPRHSSEPLTTYLLELHSQQGDLALSPSAWATLTGRSERELRRAASARALQWRRKGHGRDHACWVIGIGAMVTYATTIASVYNGVIETPEWWTLVDPKVAA